MAHTPGPWSVGPGPATSSGLAVLSSTGATVALCKHTPAPNMIDSECEANAALIAAAPAMLAALQLIVAERGHWGTLDGTQELAAAEAAIAAATGGR